MKKFIIFAIICLTIAFSAVLANAATYYVSLDGSDLSNGSESTPFGTIQYACDTAAPGDTIIVKPGVYFEHVTMTVPGTEQLPITLKAESGNINDVIITGANQAIRENTSGNIWTLVDAELNLYSTPLDLGPNPLTSDGKYTSTSYPNFPARVIVDGINLQPYNDLEGLKAFELNQGYGEYSSLASVGGGPKPGLQKDMQYYLRGPEQGYFFACNYDNPREGTLYVRLYEDGRYYNQENFSPDPNTHTVSVSSTLYHRMLVGGHSYNGWRGSAIGENSYNLGIEIPNNAPAYIIIDGFTFETPGYTGVYIGDSNVTVKNAFFRGCRAGVSGASKYIGHDDKSDNVFVENCDYTQYPTFEEGAYVIDKYYNDAKTIENKFFWWQKKGLSANTNLMVWLDYETGGFVSRMGNNWTLDGNNIYSCFDGISYVGFTAGVNSSIDEDYEVGSQNTIIKNNRFATCIDNAIEFENRATGVRMYNNHFEDNYMAISLQALNGTPWPTDIKIYNNLITGTEHTGKMWLSRARYASTWLKFGMNGEQWEWWDWIEPVNDGTYYVPPGGTKIDYNALVKMDIIFEGEGIDIFNNTVITPYQYFLEDTGWSKMEYHNFRIKNNIFMIHTLDRSNKGQALGNNGTIFEANLVAPTQYRETFLEKGPAKNGFISNTPAGLGINPDYTLKPISMARGRGVAIPGYRAAGCDLGATIPFPAD